MQTFQNYITDKEKLPKNALIITFDDGSYLTFGQEGPSVGCYLWRPRKRGPHRYAGGATCFSQHENVAVDGDREALLYYRKQLKGVDMPPLYRFIVDALLGAAAETNASRRLVH